MFAVQYSDVRKQVQDRLSQLREQNGLLGLVLRTKNTVSKGSNKNPETMKQYGHAQKK